MQVASQALKSTLTVGPHPLGECCSLQERPSNWFALLILPWEVPQSTNMWRKAEVHSQNTFCMRLSWLTECNACFPMGVFSLQHRACLCYQILKACGSTGKTCCKLCSQQRRKQGVFGSSSPLLSTVLALANLMPPPAAGAQQNCLGFITGTIFLQAARQAPPPLSPSSPPCQQNRSSITHLMHFGLFVTQQWLGSALDEGFTKILGLILTMPVLATYPQIIIFGVYHCSSFTYSLKVIIFSPTSILHFQSLF